ncbi:OTU-domain-containing protein [Durotheca rogersii]|uniref:OTU-domain-containing protein n=1 Tax=Durotheca rogersii TaxID=419775 RepID=UPI00221FEA2C|nr:OTU-domain-containing protein [Durotheca rogersii]KAI5853632.1 OTU-domain-containing protein [Durotheca rogersii]
MKIRYKAPSGGGTVELDDEATVGQLLESIKVITGCADFVVKYGWPPKALESSEPHVSLRRIGLERESLTIVPIAEPSTVVEKSAQPIQGAAVTVPPSGGGPSRYKDARGIGDENISVYMPETNSHLVLRVMPDDNNCLFTAVGGALRGLPTVPSSEITPEWLRRVVVDYILKNPDKYNAVVLEKSPEQYCTLMLQPGTWGGDIELGIISKIFELEISIVDVQRGNVYRIGEDQYDLRCVLVYSNIHYDRVAEIFLEGQAAMDFDVNRWNVINSDHVIAHTRELCKKLRDEYHYFTDTTGMVVICNECKWIGQGEKAIAEHSRRTGHSSISEIADK